VVPPALRALLLALAAVVLAAPAQASLPSLHDLARASDELQARPLAPSADLARELPTELPKECNGPFCSEPLETRVGGFDLRLSCSIGGEDALTCGTRPAYGFGYGGRAVERSVFTGHVFDTETGLYYAKARYFDPKLGRFLTQDSFLGQIDEPPSLHRYTYGWNRPTFWIDETGHAPGDWFDPRSYDWGVFAKEFGSRAVDTTANALTLGGYGGVKRGIAEGRVNASDNLSGVRAYAEGVFNTLTLGGGERAVSAYAEGKGAGGVAIEGLKGAGETVLPINEVKTLVDPTKSGWEKAEAIAMATTKVASLAAGGLAAKNAIAQRLANKPGLVTEATTGADAAMAPTEGSLPPAAPATRTYAVGERMASGRLAGEGPGAAPALREAFGSASPADVAAARHSAWSRNIPEINETVQGLGERALRASGGNWRQAEATFRRYLGGVERRMEASGGPFGVEWQPAAIPGRGRVAAFRTFRDRATGGFRTFATKGSRRLDAGLTDLSAPGPLRPLVSGYDISLDASKRSIVQYYQEAFGDIPILDIR
jgi:RHS repeat-associated protein